MYQIIAETLLGFFFTVAGLSFIALLVTISRSYIGYSPVALKPIALVWAWIDKTFQQNYLDDLEDGVDGDIFVLWVFFTIGTFCCGILLSIV